MSLSWTRWQRGFLCRPLRWMATSSRSRRWKRRVNVPLWRWVPPETEEGGVVMEEQWMQDGDDGVPWPQLL